MGLCETIASVVQQKFLTGLIGAPIAHSASPALHAQAADALGMLCHYHRIRDAAAAPTDLLRS